MIKVSYRFVTLRIWYVGAIFWYRTLRIQRGIISHRHKSLGLIKARLPPSPFWLSYRNLADHMSFTSKEIQFHTRRPHTLLRRKQTHISHCCHRAHSNAIVDLVDLEVRRKLTLKSLVGLESGESSSCLPSPEMADINDINSPRLNFPTKRWPWLWYLIMWAN